MVLGRGHPLDSVRLEYACSN
uniref:Uncharacterized protein n=1 Tax=Rhizophora mucronata TaxID=61149 RepID=A0A2P2PL53_RHIMU